MSDRSTSSEDSDIPMADGEGSADETLASPSIDSPGLSRRTFLRYVGAGAGAIFTAGSLSSALSQLGCAGSTLPGADPLSPDLSEWVFADGRGNWIPPAYPVPLPGDSTPPSADSKRLARYEVRDDLVVPSGYRYDVVAQWGDVFGPESDPSQQIRFGYDNDYTGLVPIPGKDGEYWLMVNHEYIAVRPWIQGYEEVFGEAPPTLILSEDTSDPQRFRRGIFEIEGWVMPRGNMINLANAEELESIPPRTAVAMRAFAHRYLGDLGVSVLRVRRLADGRFEVVKEATDHRRITPYSRENIPGPPEKHSRFTGPATPFFAMPPRGTMSNCSGGTSPWGTFLTCEENFHYDTQEDISPEGRPFETDRRYWGARANRVNGLYLFDKPIPPSLSGNGFLIDDPLDGRELGWVAEIDPATGHMAKHTALGRFRHENVALRVEKGQPLAAYMGDDRRGGHVWKFVSEGVVEGPTDPANSRLLEKGTLYVARFEPDFTGRWIPLVAETPLRRPEPQHGFSQHIQVPSRPKGGSVAVGDTERDNPELEVDDWIEIIERFTGKPFADCTLGDLVRVDGHNPDGDTFEGGAPEELRQRQNGILAMEAFLMANACGGTPTARPEDLEVHPKDRTIYIAFTDATDSSDGSPDGRIFPDSAMESSRQYGAIYRILEGGQESAGSDPASTTFTWGMFVASGEVAEDGGGFACADNMVFDPRANLWMVTDITTTAQNFPTSRELLDGTHAGGKNFPGVFGNNAMFMIPTEGPLAGVPQLFATAPMEAELCGPTFTEDGRTLILSVQHPGEGEGARAKGGPVETQVHTIFDRENKAFEQVRTVPVGSNFPHGEEGRAPRPAVVCITREG